MLMRRNSSCSRNVNLIELFDKVVHHAQSILRPFIRNNQLLRVVEVCEDSDIFAFQQKVLNSN